MDSVYEYYIHLRSNVRRNFSSRDSRDYWENFLSTIGGEIWCFDTRRSGTEATRIECQKGYDEFVKHCIILRKKRAKPFWIGIFLYDMEEHRKVFRHPDEEGMGF